MHADVDASAGRRPAPRPGPAPPAMPFGPLAALSAFVAVAAGAFGAHALRASLAPAALATFETAARYQLLHALALLIVAALLERPRHPAVRRAAWSFVAGTLLFSGSLYTLALSGQRWVGAVTPLGGAAFLAGWLLLAWGLWRPPATAAPE